MRVSAKADYAVRAAVELAGGARARSRARPISQAQDIPLKFLENILGELKHAGLVRSQRGMDGGYWLARAPRDHGRRRDPGRRRAAGERPWRLARGAQVRGRSEPLRNVWIAVRANLRAVLEDVTLADIAADDLPGQVTEITDDPEAWLTH